MLCQHRVAVKGTEQLEAHIVHFQRIFLGKTSPLRDPEAFRPGPVRETRRQICLREISVVKGLYYCISRLY